MEERGPRVGLVWFSLVGMDLREEGGGGEEVSVQLHLP